MASFCPYVGLQPYTENDREYFFGREREHRIIASNLFAARLTVLYGPSGVGKSSILRAGVVPYLRKTARTQTIYFNRWQDDSFLTSLKHACAEAAGVAPDPSLALDDYIAECSRASKLMLLLLLDQFEEYFLYHPDDGRFDAELARAVNRDDSESGFLIALREDWLSKLDRFRTRIPNLLGNTLPLQHLTAEAAEEAIRKPLAVYERQFGKAAGIEDELVREVLAQVRAGQHQLAAAAAAGQGRTRTAAVPIETAFLQLVLMRLWHEEQKAGSNTMRAATLRSLGGAGRIVETHLDGEIEQLPRGGREICARMFQYLVTPTGTKIAHSTEDLVSFSGRPAAEVGPVLDRLTQARLLRRLDQPERFEIFHDVLAAAIADWRRQYERSQLATRFRRRVLVMGLALIAAVAVAVFALVQRQAAKVAQEQAESARKLAESEKGRADSEARRAKEREGQANDARKQAETETSRAERLARLGIALQLAAASLEGGEGSATPVFLARHAAEVTYAVDGAITPQAKTALRVALAPEPLALTRPGLTGPPTAVALSPDGSRLGTLGSADAWIWDTRTGEPVAQATMICGPAQPDFSFRFSNDGKKLICRHNDGVEIADAEQGGASFHWGSFRGGRGVPAYELTGIQIHPDGKFAAATKVQADKQTLEVRETESGGIVATLPGPGRVLAFHYPLLVAAGIDNPTPQAVWDVRAPRKLYSLDSLGSGHLFSPDGSRLVTVLGNILDASTGRPLASMRIPTGLAEFSPDGKRLASLYIDTFRVFDTSTGRILVQFEVLGPGGSSMRFTQDGKSVIVTGPGISSRLIDIDARRVLDIPEDLFNLSMNDAAITVRLPDLQTGQLQRTLIVSAGRQFGNAAFTADGKLVAACSQDGIIRIWETATGRRLPVTLWHELPTNLAFNPSGTLLAAGSLKGNVSIWDVPSGNLVREINAGANANPTLSVAFSPDGKRLAVGGYAMPSRIFDVDSGRQFTPLSQPHHDWAMAFSPDGKRLASTNPLSISDALTGREIERDRIVGTAMGVLFAPDASRVFAATDRGLLVWQPGSESRNIEGGRSGASPPGSLGLSRSTDGKMIAAPGNGGTVILVDSGSGALLDTLRARTNAPIRSVAFDADGKHLIAIAEDWTLTRHWLSYADLLVEARRTASGNLSGADCRQFLGQDPCPAQLTRPRK